MVTVFTYSKDMFIYSNITFLYFYFEHISFHIFLLIQVENAVIEVSIDFL